MRIKHLVDTHYPHPNLLPKGEGACATASVKEGINSRHKKTRFFYFNNRAKAG